MRKTSYLLLMAIIILVASILHRFTCCNCDNIVSIATIPDLKNIKAPTNNKFNVKGYEGILSSNDNFNFRKSSFIHELPVSNELDVRITTLKNFITKNKEKKVTITGYYKSNETNNSTFTNLGLARANDIKNYLITKGFNPNTIKLAGVKNDNLTPNDTGIFLGPVDYQLNVISNSTDNGIIDFKSKFNTNPLVIYFTKNQVEVNLNKEQEKKLIELIAYLNHTNDSRCIITGYTSSEGEVQTNMDLGQQRAITAKKYLTTKNISENKMETNSVGEAEASPKINPRDRKAVITIK